MLFLYFGWTDKVIKNTICLSKMHAMSTFNIMLFFLAVIQVASCAAEKLDELDNLFSRAYLQNYDTRKDCFVASDMKNKLQQVQAQLSGCIAEQEKIIAVYEQLFPLLARDGIVSQFFQQINLLNREVLGLLQAQSSKDYPRACGLGCWHLSRRLYLFCRLLEMLHMGSTSQKNHVHVSFAENGYLMALWLAHALKLLEYDTVTIVCINPALQEVWAQEVQQRALRLLPSGCSIQVYYTVESYAAACVAGNALPADSVSSMDAVGFSDFEYSLFSVEHTNTCLRRGVYKIYESSEQNNKLKIYPKLCLNSSFKKTKDFFSLYDFTRDAQTIWALLRPDKSKFLFLQQDDLVALNQLMANDIIIFGRRPHPDFLFLLSSCVSGAAVPVVATAGNGVLAFCTSSDYEAMMTSVITFVESVKSLQCCTKNKEQHTKAV